MVIFFVKVLVICLLIGNGTSTPVAEYDKSSRYEEYIIEHEISSGSAKNAVIAMNLSSSEYFFYSTEYFRRPQISEDLIIVLMFK